jgi:hypothetical protein
MKESSITPLRSFLPLDGKMFMYLDAIRNPIKHMVNTLTIGRTANLSEASNDALVLLFSSIRILIKDFSAIFWLIMSGS